MIVIGIGTGRSGTASLAKLLNAQRDALCFHEMNPACVRFSGTPRPILNGIEEFQSILCGGDSSMLTADLSRKVVASAYDELCCMPRLRLIGDISFYYLNYVELIAERHTNVRFLGLRRDIDETVTSWINKSRIPRWRSKHVADVLGSWLTRANFHRSKNFWMEHDGTRWQSDPVWDKCFPKFNAPTKPEAIREYCEFYYSEMAIHAGRLGSVFRYVDTDKLNDTDYQSGILEFLGIPFEEQVFSNAHIHKSRPESAAPGVNSLSAGQRIYRLRPPR